MVLDPGLRDRPEALGPWAAGEKGNIARGAGVSSRSGWDRGGETGQRDGGSCCAAEDGEPVWRRGPDHPVHGPLPLQPRARPAREPGWQRRALDPRGPVPPFRLRGQASRLVGSLYDRLGTGLPEVEFGDVRRLEVLHRSSRAALTVPVLSVCRLASTADSRLKRLGRVLSCWSASRSPPCTSRTTRSTPAGKAPPWGRASGPAGTAWEAAAPQAAVLVRGLCACLGQAMFGRAAMRAAGPSPPGPARAAVPRGTPMEPRR